jgi:hypothetical protein
MERLDLDAVAAFQLLVILSQKRETPVYDVARAVVDGRNPPRSGTFRILRAPWHRAEAVCVPAPRVSGVLPSNSIRREPAMSTTSETGQVTGTKDKNYNLIWYAEKCLDNALRLETYIEDAQRDGDQEVTDLFRKAQADSQKGADMAKRLLASRLT